MRALIISFLLLGILSCSDDESGAASNCPSLIIQELTDTEGNVLVITQNGELYKRNGANCEFLQHYFDPSFKEDNYSFQNNAIFLKTENGLFPVNNNFSETFEEYSSFIDLFIQDLSETNKYWNSITLQSPATPTVQEYIALRKCILDQTCDFIDNRIELAADPTNGSNQVLKFTSLAPTGNMITAKSSLETSIQYFEKGDDFWFAADFYLENGIPTTLADFENTHFFGSPGPRIVISGNKLAIENKFGAKEIYRTASSSQVPLQEWFRVKVHLRYDNTSGGIIELWQDDEQLLSVSGINLPTPNSIQNSVEIGISATQQDAVVLVDNIRISEMPF